MLKKIILSVLAASIFINTFSVHTYAETEDTTRPVSVEQGLDTDVIEITDDTIITEDTEYSSNVNIAEGKTLIISSGYTCINETVTVNGNIRIEGSGALAVFGTVNGTVTLASDSNAANRVDWDGNYARPDNLVVYNNGAVGSIVYDNAAGFSGVGGSVDLITFTENFAGDTNIWGEARIEKIEYHSPSSIYMQGKIGEINADNGEIGIGDSKVERISAADGCSLYTSNSAVQSVYLSNAAFYNNGSVENLVCFDSNVDNAGFIGNAYVGGTRLNSYASEESVNADKYSIRNLLAENSELNISGGADNSKIYGTLYLNGGVMNADGVIAESAYIFGKVQGMFLNSLTASYIYLGSDSVSDDFHVDIPDVNSILILNVQASNAFYERHYDIISDLVYSFVSDETDVDEYIRQYVSVADIGENRNTDIPDSIALQKGEFVNIKFATDTMPGMILITDPNGNAAFASLESGIFEASADGDYRISVAGADDGCEFGYEIIHPSTTALKTYVADYEWYEDGVRLKRTDRSYKDFTIEFYDGETGSPFTDYSFSKGVFSVNPIYNGRLIKAVVTHNSASWDGNWGYQSATVEFTAGDSSAEAVCLPCGELSGWAAGECEGLRGYVYDCYGDYCCALSTENSGFYSNERFKPGRYSIVLIQDTGSNFRFRKLSDYLRSGLRQDKDYTLIEYIAENGVHAEYSDIAVPQPPRLEWENLDKSATMFKSACDTSIAGKMVEFSLLYRFENVGDVTDAYAEFLLSGDYTVLGDTAPEDSTLTLPVDLSENSLSFTITANSTGAAVFASAILHYTCDGEERSAYIGSASVNTVAISMYAPTATGKSTVTLNGIAAGGDLVTIYDGGTAVAETVCGNNGMWFCEASLARQDSPYHELCAALNAGTSNEIKTETYTVYASANVPVVEEFKFSYYVHGHSAEVKLTGEEWGKINWSYDYWPGSIFTFEVKLSNSRNISEMWISSNTNDQYYRLYGSYDEESGSWIASGKFTDNEQYLPGGFAVGWKLIEDDAEMLLNRAEELNREFEAYDVSDFLPSEEAFAALEDLEPPECAVVEIKDETDNGNGGITQTIAFDVLGTGENVLEYEVSSETIPGITHEDLIEAGYIYDSGENRYYKAVYNEAADQIEIITGSLEGGGESSLQEMSDAAQTAQIMMMSDSNWLVEQGADFVKNSLSTGLDRITKWLDESSSKKNSIANYGDISKFFSAIQTLRDFQKNTNKLNEMKQDMNSLLDEMSNLEEEISKLSTDCPKCAQKLAALKSNLAGTYADMLGNSMKLDDLIGRMTVQYTAIAVLGVAVDMSVKISTGAVGFFASVVASQLISLGMDKLTEFLMQPLVDEANRQLENSRQGLYAAAMNAGAVRAQLCLGSPCGNNCGCDCVTTTTTTTTTHTTTTSGTGSSAPDSGNDDDGGDDGGNDGGDGGSEGEDGGNPNIPNVNPDPSGYVFEAVDSNRIEGVTATVYYQDKDRNEVKWNAEEYSQINPQITDEEGKYGWTVPFGFWKVKYERDGYEAAETGWLQVPPPRTDVNTALTSYDAPYVERISLCEEFAEVEFSKYIDVETAENLICIDGESVPCYPVNAEASALGDDKTFATVFRANVSGKVANGNKYKVSVSSTALSYAGAANETAEETVECRPLAVSIAAEVPDFIDSGSETILHLSVESIGGVNNAAPDITINDSELISISDIGKPDSEGNIELKIAAAKAGVTELRVSIPNSCAEISIPIVVARESDSSLKKSADAGMNTSSAAHISVIFVLIVTVFAIDAAAIVICIVAAVIRKRTKRE